ncbi:MAG TPA: VOC family protein [Polyangia bacterium]|nr:VOC family protein [Polyangia bacterium]
MSNSKRTGSVDGPPMGLTPILVVEDAAKAIDFYKRAFGAKEIARIAAPGGGLMHGRLELFGSIVVLMDDLPELRAMGVTARPPAFLGGTPVTLHLQVADARSAWDRAIAAGAISLIPLADVFWGERYGRLRDPFGHEWTIAQMLQHLDDDQVRQAAIAATR